MCCLFIWLFQVVWQPYEAELAHLPAFCVAGRDVWTAKVPLVCFWLVEKHTPDRIVRQFGMVQEIPPYVDTDDALHDINLRGKIEVNWFANIMAISKCGIQEHDLYVMEYD